MASPVLEYNDILDLPHFTYWSISKDGSLTDRFLYDVTVDEKTIAVARTKFDEFKKIGCMLVIDHNRIMVIPNYS